jgi:two-component system cell cycle sensor histidine kinase/response regulator CckA
MTPSANRYSLYGALFGACFPLFATLLAAYLAHGALDLAAVVAVQRASPLLWIIDSAPLWLGLFAWFGGVQMDRVQATHGRLQQSEQRFRSVVDSLGEGVVLTDLSGRATYANPRAAELLGGRARNLDGSMLQALLPPPDDGAEGNPAASGSASHYTAKLLDTQGLSAVVEVRRSLVHGAAGGTTEVVAVLTDITNRLHLEEELRQAQKMEAIGKLAGGIAHDFNNMLTAIIGFADLLQSEIEASDERSEYVHEIRKAADRSAELTKQLLAFGRKQVLQPRVFDLNDVLLGMEPMLRRLIGAHIELVARCGEALPPVLADPGKLEQVLLNLVVNARDAMSDGGHLLLETGATTIESTDARMCAGLKPGSYVLLRVSDTGCGMDRETQARIFEPFFTTKPIGQGTGLGLSTVYGIVKQSGGHIEVESEPGCGTNFHIYLPCAQAMARIASGVS